jgi:hypothetical protein
LLWPAVAKRFAALAARLLDARVVVGAP